MVHSEDEGAAPRPKRSLDGYPEGISFDDLADDELVTPLVIEAVGGPSMSTQSKHRMNGVGIPFVKIGKSVRVRVGDYRQYLRANTRPAPGIREGEPR